MEVHLYISQYRLFKFFIGIISLFIASCQPAKEEWQGYNEGRFTYISSHFSGVLTKMYVDRGDVVKAKQPLFILESQPESDILNQAIADTAAAQANLRANIAAFSLAELTVNRNQALLKKHAVQQAILDQAIVDYQKAKETISQSKAVWEAKKAAQQKAQWDLKQKTIYAPTEARVFDTYFRVGELIPSEQAILSLLAKQDIKTIFYVSEHQLGSLYIGQEVNITCDACKESIVSIISFISPQAEFTPPIIYSNETRSKLVFRIEAKPISGKANLLHPGQPVSVTLKKRR